MLLNQCFSPTNAVSIENRILYVPYMKTKSVNVSVNSEQKSDTTIARTWTEEGYKCAEQPAPSIQNYAELPKKQDGINKLLYISLQESVSSKCCTGSQCSINKKSCDSI